MLPEKPWRLSDTGTPPPGAEPGDPCQAPGASPGPAPRLGRGRQACRTASPRPGTAQVPPPRSQGPSSPLSPSSLKPPPPTQGSGSSGPGGGQEPSPPTQDTRRGSLGSSRLQSSPPSLETRWAGAGVAGRGGPNRAHSRPTKPLTALGSPWQPCRNGGRQWGALGTCTRWIHVRMGLGVSVAGLGSDAFLWPLCWFSN